MSEPKNSNEKPDGSSSEKPVQAEPVQQTPREDVESPEFRQSFNSRRTWDKKDSDE
jgi:hypothetical protein